MTAPRLADREGNWLEPLPFRTKLFFGMGGISMNLCDMVMLQWLFRRYAPDQTHALLPATVLGALLMSGRIGECFYNIFLGHWSDSLRSSHGRRIPFIRGGILPLAIVFFLIFMPPPGRGIVFYCVYTFLLIQAYFCFYACVVTPYLSLLPELTADLNERVNLTTSQSIFIMFASILFSVMGSILNAGGWIAIASIVAVLTVVAMAPAIFTIREKPQCAEPGPPLLESMRSTMRNPAFWYIAGSTSCYWFGLQLVIVMLPYWVIDVLGKPESAVTLVMAPFLVMNVLAFFVFNVLTKRWGKYVMFLATLLGSSVCFALFWLIGRVPGDQLIQTMIVTGLVGVPVAGFMVIPFALLSDAVDYDAQCTDQRREAIYFSMQGVVQKIMLGLSAITFSRLVFYGGSTTATATGLRLVSLAACAASLIAFVIFLKYPLRERGGKVCLRTEVQRSTGEISNA